MMIENNKMGQKSKNRALSRTTATKIIMMMTKLFESEVV